MALTFLAELERKSSSTDAGERLKVVESMSASRGVAPARRIALTVAKKLKGVVMTVLPGPTLAAARASQIASVPLAHPMA